MEKITTHLEEIKLVGLTRHIPNTNLEETGKQIEGMMAKYSSDLGEPVQNKILSRTTPGKTYCVYTNYESDCTGSFNYFIGEEVNSFDNQSLELAQLTIPAQDYVKFTNGPGKMPKVCLDIWESIWSVSPEELGGKRTYISDFEIYDDRASDPENTTLDVLVGVSKN